MHTPEQIAEAKAALERAVKLKFAGMFGPEFVGVEIPDSDAERYLNEQGQGIELDIESYLS